MSVSSAAAFEPQLADASARLSTAAVATATAAIGTTSTDADGVDAGKTGEAGRGSLPVASATHCRSRLPLRSTCSRPTRRRG